MLKSLSLCCPCLKWDSFSYSEISESPQKKKVQTVFDEQMEASLEKNSKWKMPDFSQWSSSSSSSDD
jgi:hypothetical protein